MILDYRSPGTGTHRVQRVALELAAVQSLSWAGVALKLAVGLPLSLFGPFLISGLIFLIADKWGVDLPLGFYATLLVVTAMVLPPLMRYERRTRGDFFSDAIQGSDTSRPSSYGEWEMRRTRAQLIAYTELALYGPRLLWDVVDFLRGREPADSELRLLAAQIVIELLDRQNACNVRELLKPGRQLAKVSAALRYLQGCDWVDLSRSRNRVWLRSPIRNRLTNR